MTKNNDDFFIKKKPWSEVKDDLLGCYFKPYVSKILHTYKPLVYIDCFAGKGKFDDGKPGSPLIALRIIDECMMQTKTKTANIEKCFIELNHATDLTKNLNGFSDVKIISGKYENEIMKYLSNKSGCNVFLYIDPYGIKALDCRLFDQIAENSFNSIEMLINMNSFGFIREACRAMRIEYKDVDEFEEIVEYDTTIMNASDQSIQELTDIAGGDYWKTIVSDYKALKINGYETERRFAVQYCQRLKQKFKYVLNMPIRLQKGHRPKYRMIHATNHEDGCVLMYENICKRWQVLDEKQSGGQISFFDNTIEDDIVNLEDIFNKMKIHLQKYNFDTSLNRVLAEFFSEHGVLSQKTEIMQILQKLEKNESIIVTRNPATTNYGKPTTFFTETPKQQIKIRSRQ